MSTSNMNIYINNCEVVNLYVYVGSTKSSITKCISLLGSIC